MLSRSLALEVCTSLSGYPGHRLCHFVCELCDLFDSVSYLMIHVGFFCRKFYALQEETWMMCCFSAFSRAEMWLIVELKEKSRRTLKNQPFTELDTK